MHQLRKAAQQIQTFCQENYNIIDFEELKPIHIKYYISSLQDRGCKPAYINDLLKAVKCLCAYAQREGYSDEVLTKRVKNVKQPKVLIHTFNTKEISRMLKYYNGNDYVSVRNKMILMVFFDTGIRLSELTNMKLDQIIQKWATSPFRSLAITNGSRSTKRVAMHISQMAFMGMGFWPLPIWKSASQMVWIRRSRNTCLMMTSA